MFAVQAKSAQEQGRVAFIPKTEQCVPKTGETCHGAANPSEVDQACKDGEDTPHLNLN